MTSTHGGRGLRQTQRRRAAHLTGSTARRGLMAIGLAATLAVSPVTAPAQTYAFNSVVVEGNSRIETGTILTYAGVTRGEPISAGALNDAAQSIRATGLFQSVDLIPQGGTLVIRVTEYPTIARINFEGNSRLDDGDLGRLVQSVPRRVFSPSTAEADADRIAEAYAAQGRINAIVEPVIIQRSVQRCFASDACCLAI